MKLIEAWPEIKENTLASIRVRAPDYDENGLGFTGGGRSEVIRIERELGRKLPKDFAYYVEKLAPNENFTFEQIPTPFMTWRELYSFANLSIETFPEQRESEEDRLSEPFLIGDDSSNFIVLDLEHPFCPTYLSDEFSSELLAHSFADFMRILSYRELQLAILDAGTDYDNHDTSVEDPRWAEGEAKIKKRIMEIAPDCLKAWH